jgi:hypothetical protein
VVQSQLKICHISESISLPLECLDLIVYSLNEATRDAVKVIVVLPSLAWVTLYLVVGLRLLPTGQIAISASMADDKHLVISDS